eukprot:s221_g5.t1
MQESGQTTTLASKCSLQRVEGNGTFNRSMTHATVERTVPSNTGSKCSSSLQRVGGNGTSNHRVTHPMVERAVPSTLAASSSLQQWQASRSTETPATAGGNSIRSNSIMGEVAMDKTLQSESLDEILQSSCTHAEISMKRRQPLQAAPLETTCLQQFHLQWQPQVLSCAGEGILETINMHYYRIPHVNQEGFEGPPSFTSRVLIAS